MLDIELLRQERPRLRTHVVYRYRSGYWKTAIRERCAAIYQQRQRPLQATEDPGQFWAASLFGQNFIYYEAPPGFLDNTVVAQLLVNPPTHSLGLCLPATHSVCQTPAWKEWVQHATCIEEAEPVAANLAGIVEVLAQQLAPEIWRQLRHPAELARIFQRHLRTQSTEADFAYTIPLLAQLVPVLLWTALTPDGRGIDAVKTAQHLPAPPVSANFGADLRLKIAELCTTPNIFLLQKLVASVDTALHQLNLEPRLILALLLGITHELITINARLNPQGIGTQSDFLANLYRIEAFRTIPLAPLFVWSTQLTGAERELRTTTNLTLALHQLGMAFLALVKDLPSPGASSSARVRDGLA